MQLVKKVKILPTPDDNIFHLYNTTNSKNIIIGQNEKIWIEKLEIKKEFGLSDIKELVGERYFLSFYNALNRLGLIKRENVKKKFNIFKIMLNFNLIITQLLKFNKFNHLLEKIIFTFLPLELLWLGYYLFFYLDELLITVSNIDIDSSLVFKWLLIVFVSASLHEMSHAIVAKNYGISVPNCGIMLLLFNIAFFVDLSGVNFIKKTNNFLRIMLAGIAMNIFLSSIGSLIFMLLGLKEIGIILLIINLSMVIINSIPFFHYDGGIILKRMRKNKMTNFDIKKLQAGQIIIVFVIVYYTCSQLLSLLLSTNIYSVILSLIITLAIIYMYIKGEMLRV